MAKFIVESIGVEKQELEAAAVAASAEWIVFYDSPEHLNGRHVIAAFPTAQVFRVIPG